jgi:hypothetical protein
MLHANTRKKWAPQKRSGVPGEADKLSDTGQIQATFMFTSNCVMNNINHFIEFIGVGGRAKPPVDFPHMTEKVNGFSKIATETLVKPADEEFHLIIGKLLTILFKVDFGFLHTKNSHGAIC